MVAYRQIKQRGKPITQVLVEWAELPKEHRSWKDIDSVKRLMADTNLEDMINSDGSKDVTVDLDLKTVAMR